MNIDDFITGSYVAWLILGLIITTLSFKTWWVVKSQKRPATFFAIGIFSVWLGSSLLLRPSILYIRYASQHGMHPISDLTNHPALLIGSILSLVGGIFLVCGFTWHMHGFRTTAISVAVTVCAFAAGVWASAAGWV